MNLLSTNTSEYLLLLLAQNNNLNLGIRVVRGVDLDFFVGVQGSSHYSNLNCNYQIRNQRTRLSQLKATLYDHFGILVHVRYV